MKHLLKYVSDLITVKFSHMLLIMMSLTFFPASFLFAQNSPKFVNTKNESGRFNNSVKMNLVNAAFSYPTFIYERRIGERISFQAEGAFRFGGNSNTASSSVGNNSKAVTAYVLYPAMRYYFHESKKMKIENYFSIYYKYRSYKSVNDLSSNYQPYNIDYSNTYTEKTNGAGLLLGLQTANTSHFVFDMYFGTQLQSSIGKWDFWKKDANLNDFKENYSLSSASDAFSFLGSTSLRTGFSLGVRF